MILVLYGPHRWRRRRATARLGFAEIDAFGRPGFLYVTDTHRKRLAVAREFAERAVFEPGGRVLGEVFEELWSRWGDGRTVLSTRAAAALALDLVDRPELAALGEPDALARQLADLARRVAEVDRPVPLRPEVAEAVAALRRRWDGERHLDASEAVRGAIRLLEAPPPGLARWLAGLPPVVIDDVLQPSPLRLRALLAWIDAIDRAGGRVVVAFEGSADPGQVELLFGGEDPRSQRGFAATRRTRTAVFERFVATGRAELLEAGPDGPVAADGPRAPEPEPRPHADAVRIRRAPDVRDELEHVAREVREALDDGVPPARLHVALADADRYRHALLAVFGRYGIPADLADGPSLVTTPPGRLALRVARATVQPLGPRELLDLADLGGHDPGPVLAALRGAGVRGGPPASWRGRALAWADRVGADRERLEAGLDALERVHSALGALAGARAPSAWAERWRATAEALGAVALAERSDANRRAWGAVCRAIDELERDLAIVEPGPWLAERAGRQLAHALRVARLPSAGGGVPVTGLLELRGLSPAGVWVLGATRGRWPAPHGPNAWVDAATRRSVDPVDRLAEARWLLGSLVRLATGDPSCRGLSVSWPALDGGRPTSPSGVVAELLEELGRSAEDLPPIPVMSAPAAPRPLVGRLVRPPPPPATWPVTRAEVALRCPARHWYGEILDLQPHDPWDPELEPRARGTAIHAILQDFYRERGNRAVEESERDSARRALRAVAERALDRVEGRGGFEPALQAWARDRWLAGLTDARPAGLLAAWLDREIAQGVGPLAVEEAVRVLVGGLTLVGSLDRVDREPSTGAHRVVDYKTGGAPSQELAEAGLALQPLVYGEAVARSRGGPVAAVYQLLARPDAIRYAGWYGDADAIAAWEGGRGLAVDAATRAVRLDEAAARLREVLGGDVSTTAHGPELAGCEHCRFKRVCRAEDLPC